MKGINSLIALGRNIDKNLPEKITVSKMEEAGDILLLTGMKRLGTILSSSESSDDAVVKAVNATVNAQKYLTARKFKEIESTDDLEDDLGEVFG